MPSIIIHTFLVVCVFAFDLLETFYYTSRWRNSMKAKCRRNSRKTHRQTHRPTSASVFVFFFCFSHAVPLECMLVQLFALNGRANIYQRMLCEWFLQQKVKTRNKQNVVNSLQQCTEKHTRITTNIFYFIFPPSPFIHPINDDNISFCSKRCSAFIHTFQANKINATSNSQLTDSL